MSNVSVYEGTDVQLYRFINNMDSDNVTDHGWVDDSFFVYVEKDDLSIFLCKISDICGSSPIFSTYYNSNLDKFRINLSETFKNYEDVSWEQIFPKKGMKEKTLHSVININEPSSIWLYLAKDAYTAMKEHIYNISLKNEALKDAIIKSTPLGYTVEADENIYWVRR